MVADNDYTNVFAVVQHYRLNLNGLSPRLDYRSDSPGFNKHCEKEIVVCQELNMLPRSEDNVAERQAIT
jgi:hypothetical protein